MVLSYGPRPLTFPQSTWGMLQLKLLKFYPFRLADLMSALMVAATVSRLWTHRITWGKGSLTSVFAAGFLAAAIAIPGPDKTPGNLAGARRSDWITTLRWLRDNAPPDALLYAANEDFAVKWFSNRPEYVNFKDCPQDAGGVVEWNSRLVKFSAWSQESVAVDPSVSEAELHELGRRTGITHFIVSRFGPIDAEPVFTQGSFRVFDLRGETGPDK
jgi:hypothetical protein